MVFGFAADAQGASEFMAQEVSLSIDLQLQRTFERCPHDEAEAFAGFEAELAKVAESMFVMGVDAADDVIFADLDFGERVIDDAGHGAIRAGDGFSVGAAFGIAAHFVDFVDEQIADDQAQVIGVIVDFVPAEAHHIDEKTFDQAVAANIGESLAFTGFGQANAAIGFVLEVASVFQALHHAGDGGG